MTTLPFLVHPRMKGYKKSSLEENVKFYTTNLAQKLGIDTRRMVAWNSGYKTKTIKLSVIQMKDSNRRIKWKRS